MVLAAASMLGDKKVSAADSRSVWRRLRDDAVVRANGTLHAEAREVCNVFFFLGRYCAGSKEGARLSLRVNIQGSNNRRGAASAREQLS